MIDAGIGGFSGHIDDAVGSIDSAGMVNRIIDRVVQRVVLPPVHVGHIDLPSDQYHHPAYICISLRCAPYGTPQPCAP